MTNITLKMTGSQKKAAVSILAMVLVFIVFIVFIYIPMHRELDKTIAEYGSVEKEISDIKNAAGKDKSLDEIIAALKKRLTELENKFPAKEEQILSDLSDRAKDLKIDLINMTPDKKRLVTGIDCAALNKKGCVLQEMAITMNMRTDFRTFAGFMKSLKENFPFYIKLDSAHLVRLAGSDRHPMLDIEVKLHAYLISQN